MEVLMDRQIVTNKMAARWINATMAIRCEACGHW